MHRTKIINRILLLSAALNKEGFTNSLEQEQNAQILEEVLQNPFFAKEVALMEKDNVVFYGEQGYVPTRKGWELLNPQPQVKVVNKMQPKPTEKMTDAELLTSFVESGFAICHRLPTGKLMQKQFRNNYTDVADVIQCVTGTSNNVLFPIDEVVAEPVAAVKTSKKGKKQQVVEA